MDDLGDLLWSRIVIIVRSEGFNLGDGDASMLKENLFEDEKPR